MIIFYLRAVFTSNRKITLVSLQQNQKMTRSQFQPVDGVIITTTISGRIIIITRLLHLWLLTYHQIIRQLLYNITCLIRQLIFIILPEAKVWKITDLRNHSSKGLCYLAPIKQHCKDHTCKIYVSASSLFDNPLYICPYCDFLPKVTLTNDRDLIPPVSLSGSNITLPIVSLSPSENNERQYQ